MTHPSMYLLKSTKPIYPWQIQGKPDYQGVAKSWQEAQDMLKHHDKCSIETLRFNHSAPLHQAIPELV